MFSLIGVLGIVFCLVVIAIKRINAHYAKLCPKCGGVLDLDSEMYRHVVVWVCRDCGEDFEQLRQNLGE